MLYKTTLIQDRDWFIEYSVAKIFSGKRMQLCWGQYKKVHCLN